MEIELESSRLHLLNWNPLEEFAGYYTLALKSLFAEAPKLKMKREKENMRKSWIDFARKSQIIESQRISQMIFGSEGSGEAFISFSRRERCLGCDTSRLIRRWKFFDSSVASKEKLFVNDESDRKKSSKDFRESRLENLEKPSKRKSFFLSSRWLCELPIGLP